MSPAAFLHQTSTSRDAAATALRLPTPPPPLQACRNVEDLEGGGGWRIAVFLTMTVNETVNAVSVEEEAADAAAASESPVSFPLTHTHQMKSVQWLQKVGCLKKRAMNLWFFTSCTFFWRRAP